MQHSASAPGVITENGVGSVPDMTTGSAGGPMMTMPQTPLNGNPVMGSVQHQQPSPSDGGVQNGNQIMNNPTEGAQQFCLRWNSYPATVATQLASLRAAEDFVDVTLACDGRQLRAHKLVLSACSPYFMQLFKSTPCKHPVIFLKDVGFRQLVALLEFMYAGEVNVSQAELPALLRTAEALQVRGLADTNPNNNNFPSPPKPGFPQTFGQDETTMPSQIPQEPDATDPSGVCSTQNATNPPCDSSSHVMNPCSNTSSGKRSAKNEEESDESQDFDMGGIIDHSKEDAYMNEEDGSLPQQFEDTGEVFPQNIGDANSFDDLSQGDLGSEDLLPGENHTDEEGSDVEEDENSLDCSKDFPGFPGDGTYENLGDLAGTPNGSSPGMNAAGPSGNHLGGVGGPGEPGNPLAKGGDGMLLPPPAPGEGRGRNRLARSLWPPGIPYHGPQQCPYCPRVLSNVGNWRKHVLTMHFAREKVYKCHLCSSAFRTSEYLQKHYVRVHNHPQKMTRKKFVEQT